MLMTQPDRHPDGLSPEASLQTLVASDAVNARQRRHWGRQEDRETTTLVGLLVNLAEWGGDVSLDVDGGRRFVGALRGVGADVATLHGRDGRALVISLDYVSLVRPQASDRTEHTGDRPATLNALFNEVLAELSTDRPSVAVHLGRGEPVQGRLQWCGLDVCCLRSGTPAQPVYVPLMAIAAVAVTS